MRHVASIYAFFCGLAVLGVPQPVCGLDLRVDYTHDTYISTNATAMAALEAAADDVSAAITTSLNAINATDDPIEGQSGLTTVTFDWRFTYSNPATSATETVNIPEIPQNEVIIFAGGRNLTGTTLGRGGPMGAGLDIAASGFPSELVAATADAESKSNAVYPRGGPKIGGFSGSLNLGTVANYDLSYGSSLGSVAFDLDTDNNGVQDSPAQLEASWHFDHTTPPIPAENKNDFYSLAVHELLHALGIGSSDSWDGLTSGTTWNGSAAQALNGGSGLNLVNADGVHIRIRHHEPAVVRRCHAGGRHGPEPHHRHTQRADADGPSISPGYQLGCHPRAGFNTAVADGCRRMRDETKRAGARLILPQWD